MAPGAARKLPPQLKNCLRKGFARNSGTSDRFKSADEKRPRRGGANTTIRVSQFNCKLASNGRDCKRGGCRGRRKGRAPPQRPAQPRCLVPHWDGKCRQNPGASRGRSHRRRELSARPVSVARSAWLGWRLLHSFHFGKHFRPARHIPAPPFAFAAISNGAHTNAAIADTPIMAACFFHD